MNATYYPPVVNHHRPTSSFHYAPTTTNNYQPQQQPPQQQSVYQHGHSQSYYQPQTSNLSQVYTQPQQQQTQLPPPPPQPIHYQAPPPLILPVNQLPPPTLPPVAQHQEQIIPTQQVAQQPEVNGGINSVLEYDLNQMSSFLGWCTFGMLKQQTSPSKDFDNLISSVLFATRLPKSTIIIALEYMNQRFSSKFIQKNLAETEIFNFLVVSLVLANKFNDDNTFTNKSWCGATGLQILKLNKLENEWLEEIKWSLSIINFESNILILNECWKTWCEKYSTSGSTKLSPIITNNSKYNNYNSNQINPQNVYSTPTISPSSMTFDYQSSSSPNSYTSNYGYNYQQQQQQQIQNHYHQNQQQYLSSSPIYQDPYSTTGQYNNNVQYYPPQSTYQQHHYPYSNFNQIPYNNRFYMAC
ncbi:CLG1 [Candida pseudojiufengensis]|uniref:CLG1 n=1 Tax=Candida pseudojiufengensis TaxID=497109 RepID=UPI00222442C6|nr:CLG1 [Candida pseudojiufengensis]KAI5962522.1 CLG1 [Candida pseudojiufengensis]